MTCLTAQLVGVLLIGVVPYDTPQPPVPTDDAARIQQLEQGTPALPTGLDPLPSQPAQPPVELTASANNSVLADAPTIAPEVEPQFYTLDQLRAELAGDMKKYAWTKGDYTVVPYGILWGTATYETERTNFGDSVFWVLPKNTDGEAAFHCDARSTRLGLDVTGPRIPWLCCAQSGGKVEIDFQRMVDTENRATVLLRHAYAEVKNEDFRLLAGQTWDVISPLFPGMLMYSVGWAGGNIGYRRAQMRGERYIPVSDTFLVTAQGSINSDLASTNETATNFNGDHAGWPVAMTRVAATLGNRGPGCRPIEIGFSGHVGELIYDFKAPTWPNPVDDLARRTWSANIDFRMPITSRFGVQGELFTGENLGTFFGGIVQGIDMGTPTNPGTRRSVRSRGGWIDVWYDWTPRLHSHVGYSIDDPVNSDLTTGRTYNAFYFGNISFDVTPKFLVGLEVSSWKTLWIANQPGESVNSAFVVKYGF